MEAPAEKPAEKSAPRKALPARVIDAVVAWAFVRKPVRAVLLYVERRGPMLADSVTYRALFSVFAGVLLGFSLAGFWLAGNPAAFTAIVDAVQAAVPGLIGDDGVVDPDDLVSAPISLSVAGIISLVALIGAALGAVGSLRTAARVIAGTASADILWVWVILRNLLLAVLIGGSFVVAAALTFSGQFAIEWLAGLVGISDESPLATWSTRGVSLVIVFALDSVLVAAVFRLLAGVKPGARSLWSGALLGGLGLLALQQLSGLFVGGATSNPLLASFATLLALLIWLNLSAQVILIACAYIATGVEEERDRVRARFGATTFPQHRVQRAEQDVALATAELREAQRAANPDDTKH